MVQPLNDGSFWFIGDREGRVYSFANDEEASSLTSVLDISSRVSTSGVETGFTGMAFHPNYPDDNRIFVMYNDANWTSTLSSFTVNTDSLVVDPNSETVFLQVDQPGGNHNGGDIAFDSDGLLYATLGDGGEGFDGGTAEYAQRNGNLLGTVIRIDISETPYAIPNDNPFNTGQARCNNTSLERSETCPEIYAYGLRNPWRFSIDMETDAVWLGDVGEDTYEEVNRVEAGGNYGWPIMEGPECFSSPNCDTSGLSLPIVAYTHDEGQSVVGGYVYRGTQAPALTGKYIYGDIYTQQFFEVDADAPAGSSLDFSFNSQRQIFTMAQGNDGEVYLINSQPDDAAPSGDAIFRLSDSGGVTVDMPNSLSDTGCFNTAEKTSPSGVFDYNIISQLWSDGAEKTRAFAIPDDTTIDVLVDGDFDFPTDSVLIKHFLDDGVYLETRLFINHSTGWQGYSYEWNDEQTDASLLTDGKTKAVGDYVHIYPTRAQCTSCHTNAANGSLGIELLQLNRDSTALNANFIDYLSEAGYLTTTQSSSNSPTLYSLDDDTATLEQRARSYLHSNCSGCHRPNAVFADMDLRFSTSFADTDTCGVNATVGDLGVSGAQRIAPGNPDASVMLLRMETDDPDERMPTLGTNVEHEAATALIRSWISSLSGCD